MNFLTIAIILTATLVCLSQADSLKDQLEKAQKFADDLKDKSNNRELEVEVENNEFKLKAKATTDGVTTIIRYGFTTDGFPRFSLLYFNGNKDGASASSFAYRVGVAELFEFVDTGSNGFDGETPSKSLKLSGQGKKWSKIVARKITNDDGSYYYSGNTTYTNSAFGSGFSFTLRLDIANQYFVANLSNQNISLSPNSLKWSATINNWPFAGADGTSKLAMALVISSGAGFGHEKKQDSSTGVPYVGIGDAGAFAWAPVVTAGTSASNLNTDIAVVASSLIAATTNDTQSAAVLEKDGGHSDDDDNVPSANANRIVFTLDTTTHYATYYWDPEVALSSDSSLNSANSIVASFMALLLSSFVAFFIMF